MPLSPGGGGPEISAILVRFMSVAPLGLDTFALSTVLGLLPLARPQRLRIAVVEVPPYRWLFRHIDDACLRRV